MIPVLNKFLTSGPDDSNSLWGQLTDFFKLWENDFAIEIK